VVDMDRKASEKVIELFGSEIEKIKKGKAIGCVTAEVCNNYHVTMAVMRVYFRRMQYATLRANDAFLFGKERRILKERKWKIITPGRN